MNKEFENQKQEIINALDEIFRGSDLRMHNQLPDVPNRVITIEDLSKGFNLLKQLQPPKLPTCATCIWVEPLLNQCGVEIMEACGECSNEMSRFYHKVITKNNDVCIHHSHYEVAK